MADAAQLHFLLIPLLSQSHIIPFTHFANSLEARGARVSILTTPLNAARHHSAVADNIGIHLIPIAFPCREAGLPDGCENMDSLTSPELAGTFFRACEMLQAPVETLIQNLHPKPSCIVSSCAIAWPQKIAKKFDIPGYIFETVSCFTLVCARKLSLIRTDRFPESERFLIPDIPHEIEFSEAQLWRGSRAKEAKESDGYVADQIRQARATARAALVNSFQELEPWYAEGWRKESGMGNVWCVGPVSFNSQNSPDLARFAACLSWLDSMKQNSIVYACFGSLCQISVQQLKEIGLGLEASNHPFIWIIGRKDCSSEIEHWLDEGFEERVTSLGRGLVIRGWAPQVEILHHVAVGGFLTHCGWNSTLEGVCAAAPMVTWPMFADQFYNEMFIVDVLGIGVRVGVEKIGDFVEWERVRIGVEELMGESEGALQRRRRALELAKMAEGAVKKGGSTDLNLNMFIQDVLQFR